MRMILFFAYCIIGYWAAGVTIYANKIRFGSMTYLFMSRFVIALFLGWILIPWAIIKMIIIK